jgi:hypothetical protein
MSEPLPNYDAWKLANPYHEQPDQFPPGYEDDEADEEYDRHRDEQCE